MWHLIAIKQIEYGSQNTWIHNQNLILESNFVRYINCLYYSVLTMITVGHFNISSTSEKGLSIILVLILSGGFAYSLNQVGRILEFMYKSEVELKFKYILIFIIYFT